MNDFDQRAATWDDDPEKLRNGQALAAAIARRVPLGSQTRLLDYGCGTGLVSLPLHARVGSLTLVDSSAGMLDVVRAKIAQAALEKVTCLQADFCRDPLPPQRFDLIVTALTLHHVPDARPLLRVFFDLLEVGGTLCIADLEPEDGSFHGPDFAGHRGFDRGTLSAALRANGFVDLAYETCLTIRKPMNGTPRDFPVFLATARRPTP